MKRLRAKVRKLLQERRIWGPGRRLDEGSPGSLQDGIDALIEDGETSGMELLGEWLEISRDLRAANAPVRPEFELSSLSFTLDHVNPHGKVGRPLEGKRLEGRKWLIGLPTALAEGRTRPLEITASVRAMGFKIRLDKLRPILAQVSSVRTSIRPEIPKAVEWAERALTEGPKWVDYGLPHAIRDVDLNASVETNAIDEALRRLERDRRWWRVARDVLRAAVAIEVIELVRDRSVGSSPKAGHRASRANRRSL